MASTLDRTRTRGLFLAGEWVETGEWDEVRSPYSGEVVGTVARGTPSGRTAPPTGVPPYRAIAVGTCRAICRQLGIAPPDAELYTRVADAFPEAWIEDPALTPDTLRVLEPYRDRITWDAAIHEWSDVEALPFRPRCLNCKPSRFGSVRRLFDFYDACEREGIALYGGGQFELGPGRPQIQLLASIFHADAPNDVAPGGYNAASPVAGLPTSPLAVASAPGFR